jgi:hypothetical protein
LGGPRPTGSSYYTSNLGTDWALKSLASLTLKDDKGLWRALCEDRCFAPTRKLDDDSPADNLLASYETVWRHRVSLRRPVQYKNAMLPNQFG